uniref:CYP370A15 n=1 Tax=Diaphanosoma celebensis TaxID=2184134 RepID=A0A896SZB0_9CRUS|nr:CYP370A15 [Diaphanosoma celebensis]QST15067.1 CYP370A5 protein [Diaphanosoma celebensis]
MDVYFTICAVAVLLFLLWRVSRRPDGFPPGPRGVPLLGYIPFVKRHDPVYPFKAMMKLSEMYGPVVGFYMGPRQAFISVCGYEAVKEALHNDDIIGRPHLPAQQERTYGKNLGIMFTEGQFWQEQRRFTLRHLRDLGFGKTSIEDMMIDEVVELLDEITAVAAADPDRVVDYKGIFNISVINVLWAIVGGERYRRDDRNLKKLLQTLETIFRSGNALRSAVPMPAFVFRMFPFLREYFGTRNDLFTALIGYFESVIKEHEETFKENEPRDFIDVYLQEIRNRSDPTFHVEQLVSIILDIFAAGAESVTNSIGFVLLYLLHHPDVQRKMQEELDVVCGDSLPKFEHRLRLPYTEAVLMEVQRIGNIAPFTVPHLATKETRIKGFTVPKGSIVSINIHSVHNEVAYWKDPHVFRPERHLDARGKVIRTDHFLPFGAGKRLCIGESLAKNTFYLFVTALVKTLRFSAVPGQPLPTLNPRNGFTLGYEGFLAVTHRRC